MGLRVQVDGFKVVVTASLQNIFAAELLPSFLIFPLNTKFESRNEWLGIRD